MPLDIDLLTESELIDLNHRIVARLRFLRQLEAHSTMLEFRIGERVTFHPDGRPPVTGMITRYNKKTAGTWLQIFWSARLLIQRICSTATWWQFRVNEILSEDCAVQYSCGASARIHGSRD